MRSIQRTIRNISKDDSGVSNVVGEWSVVAPWGRGCARCRVRFLGVYVFAVWWWPCAVRRAPSCLPSPVMSLSSPPPSRLPSVCAPAGADDFLPVFIYILTLSRLHRPATSLAYIQYLTPQQDLAGELAYYVTTLESALYFVSEILIDLNEDGMIHAGVDVASAMRSACVRRGAGGLWLGRCEGRRGSAGLGGARGCLLSLACLQQCVCLVTRCASALRAFAVSSCHGCCGVQRCR